MSFQTAIYLKKATSRAKSDVANKLISMFLHELSRKLGAKLGMFVSDQAYTAEVERIFGSSCAYCGRHLEPDRASVEHLDGMNRQRAGLHIVGNVLVACKRCNNAKRQDDSLKTLQLATTGWESFLAHDGSKCVEGCKNCAYWRALWPDESERAKYLLSAIERIRTFRAQFPKAAECRARAEKELPEVMETIYREGQHYAASVISAALTKAMSTF